LYLAQSRLVMQVIPIIHDEQVFSLKGGTAINFFIRDLPRLSIDIDLTYSDVESRDITLEKSTKALNRIIAALTKRLGLHVVIQKDKKGEFITKIEVQGRDAQIKIEPNFVFRGSVFPTTEKQTQPKVEALLGCSAIMRILSFEDLYAGKLCAMLNRQHPRDVFDAKLLLDNEGISDKLLDAFVIYLASDSRPIDELLSPNIKDLTKSFNLEFRGMTREAFDVDALIDVRDYLCKNIINKLSQNHKQFLLSLMQMRPQWGLVDVPVDIESLPGIRFKQINLKRMSKKKHLNYLQRIESLFAK